MLARQTEDDRLKQKYEKKSVKYLQQVALVDGKASYDLGVYYKHKGKNKLAKKWFRQAQKLGFSEGANIYAEEENALE